jgi:hypothetical protein
VKFSWKQLLDRILALVLPRRVYKRKRKRVQYLM